MKNLITPIRSGTGALVSAQGAMAALAKSKPLAT